MNLMFYILCAGVFLTNVFVVAKNLKASSGRIDKFKNLFLMGVLIVSFGCVSFIYFVQNS